MSAFLSILPVIDALFNLKGCDSYSEDYLNYKLKLS